MPLLPLMDGHSSPEIIQFAKKCYTDDSDAATRYSCFLITWQDVCRDYLQVKSLLNISSANYFRRHGAKQ